MNGCIQSEWAQWLQTLTITILCIGATIQGLRIRTLSRHVRDLYRERKA